MYSRFLFLSLILAMFCHLFVVTADSYANTSTTSQVRMCSARIRADFGGVTLPLGFPINPPRSIDEIRLIQDQLLALFLGMLSLDYDESGNVREYYNFLLTSGYTRDQIEIVVVTYIHNPRCSWEYNYAGAGLYDYATATCSPYGVLVEFRYPCSPISVTLGQPHFID